MFLIIAFWGGMISLLSPCTLPVIPLLFAGFQGQRKHILALLAGMIVMFTLVAMVVTVASEWIADATVIGRWIALLILSIAALGSDLPAVCSAHCPSGGQCGKRSQHPQRSATRPRFRLFWQDWPLDFCGPPVPDRFSGRSSALILRATRPSQPERC